MNGLWISADCDIKAKNLYFRARRKFRLDKLPSSQKLHIGAESYYKLWVNGQLLGSGPARGSRSLNYFDSYEVAPFLRPGENVVAVLVQSMNIPNFVSFPSCGAVIVELEGLLESDASWEALVNGEWERDVEIFCVQCGFMEQRDLRKEPLGWLLGKDSAQWKPAKELGLPEEAMDGKRLLPRPVPMLVSTSHLPAGIPHAAWVKPCETPDVKGVAATLSKQPHAVSKELEALCSKLCSGGRHDVRIEASAKGDGVSIVFDFAREVIGFFELELSASAGTIIDLAYDEELENGRVDAARNHYRMADRYLARDGVQTVGCSIHERGFRVVEAVVRNFKGSITLHSAKAIDRRHQYPARASFNCSDMLLRRVWDVCAETLSACTTDVFNDCPWRERAFWVNDLIVENVASLQAFGDPAVNAHALRLALSNARPDGWIPGVCPDNGDPRLVLTPTNLLLTLMLKDYLLYSGDMELVEETLPQMLALQDKFDALMDKDGVIAPLKEHWNFFDWSYGLNNVSLDGKKTSLLNWLYCWARNEGAWLLELLGKSGEASECRKKASSAAKATDKAFWVESEARYADWLEPDASPSKESSQLAHAFALLSGSLPENRKENCVKALANPGLLVPELYLHHFVLNAMHAHGLDSEAIARIAKYWGDIVKTGSPTLWEAGVHQFGKKAFWNAGSLCHGFGTTPINFFQTAVLGVAPLEAGFKSFCFKPSPCGLDSVSGSVPTPAGAIKASWTRRGGRLEAELSVPHGLKAISQSGEFGPGVHRFEIEERAI